MIWQHTLEGHTSGNHVGGAMLLLRMEHDASYGASQIQLKQTQGAASLPHGAFQTENAMLLLYRKYIQHSRARNT